MIDLHSHILPGIDDGARNLDVSLEMARMAVASGVTVMACTPHILQGGWNNTGPDIRNRAEQLQSALDQEGIPLHLVTGADIHVAFDLVKHLRSGRNLSLADTRYVLLELPHHVPPARLEDCFFACSSGGYVPILTHPERLSWIDGHYDAIKRLASAGVWMQITAGSLTGAFGRRARYWGERMLSEGLVHILATDAHDTVKRPPILHEGRRCAEGIVGVEEAHHLVETRPRGILENAPPNTLPLPTSGNTSNVDHGKSDVGADDGADDRGPVSGHLGGRMRKLFGWGARAR